MAFDLLDINNDVYKYEANPGTMKEVCVSHRYVPRLINHYKLLYTVYLDKLSKPRWEEGYVVLNSSPFLAGAVLSKLKL